MQDAEQRVLKLLSSEPRYRLAFHRILRGCEEPKSFSEVTEEVLSLPQMKTAIHEPGILLGWLEAAGGVERAEGEEQTWQTTEAGRTVAEMEMPEKRLLELISAEPGYGEIYLQILRFCETPRKKDEIEALLRGNPMMEKPRVYPTFFISGLEQTGGLEWVGRLWKTTEVGKGVVGG